MKRIMVILAAMFLACCSGENEVPGGAAEIRIMVSIPQTKASADALGETRINTLQILVFSGSRLEGYVSGHSSPVSLSCSIGRKDIWAVVNGPDLSAVNSPDELESIRFLLEDNSAGNFQMAGHREVDVTSDGSISVSVGRLVSKVTLGRITVAFQGTLADADFTIKGIYLTNVAGDCTLGSGGTSLWYNRMMDRSEQPALLRESCDEYIYSGNSWEQEHSFYCFPNTVGTDSSSPVWCPRRTRLVIEAILGENTCWYPVTLPVMAANRCYTIGNLVLTRPGSSSPDIPVSALDIQYTLTADGWASAGNTIKESI